LVAARRGFRVTAVDLLAVRWPFAHAGITFVQGDIRDLVFGDVMFDLIINCSAIEHVGLAGRYGVRCEEGDGDLQAMRRLQNLARPGGTMLLTLPVGEEGVYRSMHRVYGEARLDRLLSGWLVEDEQYWSKQGAAIWSEVPKGEAFLTPTQNGEYALGLFVLRRASFSGHSTQE